jgi:hypothetical protein
VSYTYAVMTVGRDTFTEIKRKLAEAGYNQAIHQDAEFGEVLDMRGIALSFSADDLQDSKAAEPRYLVPGKKHEHRWVRQEGLLVFESADGSRQSRVRGEVEMCLTCDATRPVQS